ncbi:hypothetical protein [Streptomyces sp. NPDC091212]|uniref:hypothetical protein n=1 Tax=Streptomyces sp. NPDC091212 TaxID=3155191 RepID=UPI003448E988
MIAMILSGAFGDGVSPRAEQALSDPTPVAAAAPAASLPKERRLRNWLLVDILVLVFLM